MFEYSKFHYDTNRDVYICPNNQELKKALCTQKRNDRINFVYRGTSSMCKSCILRDKCLPQKTACKSIYRWEHQEILDKHIFIMNTKEAKEAIKQRSALAEHPFGTIKQTLGWSHFLVRGKEKVSGENALIMFTYNFKRMLNLIGIALFRKLIIAIKEGDTEAIREEIVAYIACIYYIWMKYLLEARKILFPTKNFSF